MKPEVVELSREFICVRVDGDLREDLAMGANVEDYPVMRFLTPEGGVILLGGPNGTTIDRVGNDYTNSAERAMHFMKQAIAQRAPDRERLAAARAAADAAPDAVDGWYELGKYFFERKAFAAARAPLERVLTIDPHDTSGKLGFTLERLMRIELEDRAWERLRELIAVGRAANPDRRLLEVYYYYEFNYHLRGALDPAAAERTIATMQREFPRGSLARRARDILQKLPTGR
jgi:tetratricopeptide (TPR) repeat protein